MAVRVAELLAAARRRRFVGRAAELAQFAAILQADRFPFCVLFVYGPGGIGKTTLLGEMARHCADAGVAALRLDARNLDPTPDGFLGALARALGQPDRPALATLATEPRRRVLFVDTYERLRPLDDWLREQFLPELPGDALVVLAGRQGPGTAWLSDSGWHALLHRLSLTNFNAEESATYLARRAVPADQHEDILAFTHGHPLALSLVADAAVQRPGSRFQPRDSPDVVRTLVEQLVEGVPGPTHRAALEASALLRLTTEPLLAELVQQPDVRDLFTWLCSLSFVQLGPLGAFPHDLAREALVAELRWRNPDWYVELHRRARLYFARRLQETRGPEQERVLFDYFYLHRDSPVIRPFFEWQETGGGPSDGLKPGDLPHLLDMMTTHEGPEAARLAEHWLTQQPAGAVIFRGAGGAPAGLLLRLDLHELAPDAAAVDPAVAAALAYLARHAPLRPGERAALFRFWLARDGYQGVSAIQTRVFGSAAQYYLTTPGLAFSFFPCADPDFWLPALTYADLARLPEADFAVGGRRYGMFGHDWRATPPLTWLTRLAEREVAAAPAPAATASTAAPALVLSHDAFVAALRDALRDLHQPAALRRNPLRRSRLITERAGDKDEAAQTAALQALLKEAAEELRRTPREVDAYKALLYTYFRPAPSQERAAELLGWSFSTFRRRLKEGVDLVTERLWERELGGAAGLSSN